MPVEVPVEVSVKVSVEVPVEMPVEVPVEVPLIEVPVIEAPLAPLVPSPYGAGNAGDTQAGGENSLMALQAKIAELELQRPSPKALKCDMHQ